MKNKNWGWWTAWFNLIGQFAIVAGIDYAAAGFLNATIRRLGSPAASFDTTAEIDSGHPHRPARDDGRDLCSIQLALNIAGINLVACSIRSACGGTSSSWRVVVVLIFATGKPDQSGLTLFAIQPLDTAGSWKNTSGSSSSLRAGDHATR